MERAGDGGRALLFSRCSRFFSRCSRRRPPDDCDGRRRCGLLLLSNACRGTRFDHPLDGACPRRLLAMPLLLPLPTLRWLAVGVIGPPKLPTPAPPLCALTILPVPTLPATANVRADTTVSLSGLMHPPLPLPAEECATPAPLPLPLLLPLPLPPGTKYIVQMHVATKNGC